MTYSQESPAGSHTETGSHVGTVPLFVSAKSKSALARQVKQLADYLETNPNLNLWDVSFTLLAGREHFSHRFAFTCDEMQQAVEALRGNARGVQVHVRGRKKGLQLVFPKGLLGPEPLFIPKTLDTYLQQIETEMAGLDETLRSCHLRELSNAWETLQQRFTTVALQWAACRYWQERGFETPEMVGIGLGEWAAALASGVLDLKTLFNMLRALPQYERDTTAFHGVIEGLKGATIPIVSGHRGTLTSAQDWQDASYWLDALERSEHDPAPLLHKPGCVPLVLGPKTALGNHAALEGIQAIHSFVPEMDRGQLLTELYLQGLTPNWQCWFEHLPGRRVPLPTYVFDEKRYWFAAPKVQVQPETKPQPARYQQPQGEPITPDLSAMIETMDETTLDRLLALYEAVPEQAPVVEEESAHQRPEMDTDYVAPRDDLEREVAALCAQLLQIDRIGVDDNIVHLGADSMFTMQLSRHLDERYGVTLTPHHLFAQPTVASLTQTLRKERR